MGFWLLFVAIQMFLFLPLYLANIRQQRNPFAFITEQRFWNKNKLKLLYSKQGFSDPFHCHLEFTLLLLLFIAMQWTGPIAAASMTFLLTLFQIEIIYTAVLTYIFSRPPVFVGDWPLIKSGWVLWKGNRHWILMALVALILILLGLNFVAATLLLSEVTQSNDLLLAIALLCLAVLPVAWFNWRSYEYTAFHFRTVYSVLLHCLRNIQFGRQFNVLFEQNSGYFDEKNVFKQVQFVSPAEEPDAEQPELPDVVHVCIESYGAILFQDPELRQRFASFYSEFEQELQQAGFCIASNLSTSPIFTGGSWLSYSTFMYGFRFDNLQLYDGLFQYSDNFGSYESVFHILKRNHYHHVLAAPLGGVDNQDVSWDTISRCFQPHRILDWESYDYRGPKMRFFNQDKTFCLPDQYALNFAYDKAREEASQQEVKKPVSLFYCTMNSHVPFESPVQVEANWRTINHPEYQPAMTDTAAPVKERYLQAIEYQLRFALSFVKENKDKNLLVTLFGDHQPPFVATEAMGRETPVHVICKQSHLQDALVQQGFHPGLTLPANKAPMRHEAWLSLFVNAMNQVYGKDKSLALPLLPNGVDLFPSH